MALRATLLLAALLLAPVVSALPPDGGPAGYEVGAKVGGLDVCLRAGTGGAGIDCSGPTCPPIGGCDQALRA